MLAALLERPTTLEASAEAARVEVVQPLALDPDTTSPVLASMARAWHEALEPADRVALLAPVLPRLAGTKGPDALEERRAVMAADWAIRCYLPNWLHRAGLQKVAAAFGALAPMTMVDDLVAVLPALERAAVEGNAAWVAARERAKAVTPPDAWDQAREDVRNAVRYIILATAEASIRVPLEDPTWARSAHYLWEAAAACFWASAWDGVTTGTGSTIDRVAAVMLPMRAGLSRAAMDLLSGMAGLSVQRQAFYDLEEFPDLQTLAQAWPEMRQDLDVLHAPLMNVDRVNKPHAAVVAEVGRRVAAGEPYGFVKGWTIQGGANPDWTQYGLVLGDQPIPFAKAPRTLALLAGLRGLKLAAFARLAPGTVLPTHTHPEIASEGLLQAHLVLKAPAPSASCLLNVAGELRQHVTGGAIVFDGSLPHAAVNMSGEDRVILYLEFNRAAHHRPRQAVGGQK